MLLTALLLWGMLMPFERVPEIRFNLIGIDLSHSPDVIKPPRVPFSKNVRSVTADQVETRPGLSTGLALVGGQSPCHGARRLNDKNTGAAIILAGVGTHLASADTALGAATDRDSGYSGDPLTMVPWRPDQSPQSWMYVADRSRMRRVSWDGATFRNHPVGLPPPNVAPVLQVGLPAYKVVEDFTNAGVLTGAGLTGGLATLLTATGARRVDTTITGITPFGTNSVVTGVVPASMANIIPGTRINNTTAASIGVVDDTFPGGVETTIQSIIYDSGTSGPASVQLKQASRNLRVGATLRLSTLTGGGGTVEYVGVNAVMLGPDDNYSIRITTVGTWAAAHFVSAMPSFTITVAEGQTWSVTQVLRSEAIRATVTGGATPGTITHSGLTLDLTDAVVYAGYTVQASGSDYMHIDLRADKPALITEIKVEVDIDDSTFLQNFYYRSFRPDDLTPVLEGTQTAIANRQARVQRQLMNQLRLEERNFVGDNNPADNPEVPQLDPAPGTQDGGAGDQLGKGRNQWSGMSFRLGDMTRSGTDKSKDLSTVKAVRVSITSTAAVVIDMDSWWIGGGYGPDSPGYGYGVTTSTPGQPYFYRYRIRNSLTGAMSNWSPVSLGGATPHRQIVYVVPTQFQTADADKIDIQRFGGVLLEWHDLATVPNASASYGDTFTDDAIAANPGDGNIHFQPWPIQDTPKSGTTAASGVSGIAVKDVGTNFNTSWAPGTAIKIDGIWTSIYQVISTSLLLVVDSLGSRTSVTWEIPQPLILGQPLPVLVGPVQGFFGACGDLKNPGRWYYSNGNDPDGTQETHWIEVTPPSEPIINGIPNGSGWIIFSSARAFAIEPAFTLAGAGGNLFVARELAGWPGLFSRWAICSGRDGFYWMAKDGIYRSDGGTPIHMTISDLGGWFPVEELIGRTVNGLAAPNLIAANATKFQLGYGDGELYFDYIDTAGNINTLTHRIEVTGPLNSIVSRDGGWKPYTYTPSILAHEEEEGENIHGMFACGNDGKLYRIGGATDAGTAIACEMWTHAFNGGDGRSQKDFGDLVAELDAAGIAVTITPFYDNFSTSFAARDAKVVSTSGRATATVDLNGGTGQYAKNIGLKFTWSGSGPVLYFWQPAFLPRPEDTFLRATDFTDAGYTGAKYFREVHIEADTGGAAVPVLVEYVKDDGTIGNVTININHPGKSVQPYVFTSPFIAMEVRLRRNDSSSWKLYSDPPHWIFDKEPDLVAQYGVSQQESYGMHGFHHYRPWAYIALSSTAAVNWTVSADGTAHVFVIPSTTGLRQRLRVPLDVIKSKLDTHKLTSTAGFRLYRKDCEIGIKEFGTEGPFQIVAPFGTDEEGHAA